MDSSSAAGSLEANHTSTSNSRRLFCRGLPKFPVYSGHDLFCNLSHLFPIPLFCPLPLRVLRRSRRGCILLTPRDEAVVGHPQLLYRSQRRPAKSVRASVPAREFSRYLPAFRSVQSRRDTRFYPAKSPTGLDDVRSPDSSSHAQGESAAPALKRHPHGVDRHFGQPPA